MQTHNYKATVSSERHTLSTSKGQGHHAALLTAVLVRQVAAAVGAHGGVMWRGVQIRSFCLTRVRTIPRNAT